MGLIYQVKMGLIYQVKYFFIVLMTGLWGYHECLIFQCICKLYL